MFPRRWRLGIRPQLTLIVILGTLLTTIATLFIADNAIKNYVLTQAQTQERDNSNIALLVLHNNYGANISISADNQLVADSPNAFNGSTVNEGTSNGKFPLNGDTDYVDSVKHLINADVSLYQCANSTNAFTGCVRQATTFIKNSKTNLRDTGANLNPSINQGMQLATTPQEWLGTDAQQGVDYYADYTPIFNGQHQLVGVLAIEVPLDTINNLINRTTVELILIGTIIMIAGIILALFFANTIITALQRAARQVNSASERIGGIATQQASGSAQQVWAINAINQALQNFSDTAKDISQRTDQLALMGNQVLQRRGEIPPQQIDSILAYMTRSVRDISGASRQQAAQYERMTGAMQAVIEIAEQVAGNSQQSTESAERLELVVRQLQQVVGVRLAKRSTTTDTLGIGSSPDLAPVPTSQNKMKGTVRSVRPDRQKEQEPALAGNGRDGYAGAMGTMGNTNNRGMMPRPAAGMMPGMMPPTSSMGMGGMSGNIGNMGMNGPMDRRMMGGGMGSGNMGGDPNQGGWQSGRAAGYMGGGMNGPRNSGGLGGYGAGYGMGANTANTMGVDDWRLPPLPDIEPPLGWEEMRNQPYRSLPPQSQMGGGSRSGQLRPLLPPQRVPDYNNNNGNPNNNQNGGWSR